MDLFEIKKSANDLIENADFLAKQYERIVDELAKIYQIIRKTNSEEARKLKILIDKYNSMISIMNKECKEPANQILNYVDASNQNLKDFTENVKLTSEIFNENVENIDS